MLTAKLIAYTREEVDKLKELIEESSVYLIEQARCDNNCRMCKYKHVCQDLELLLDYLTREQENGYPHAKK